MMRNEARHLSKKVLRVKSISTKKKVGVLQTYLLTKGDLPMFPLA